MVGVGKDYKEDAKNTLQTDRGEPAQPGREHPHGDAIGA
jgi:hypothetical protein